MKPLWKDALWALDHSVSKYFSFLLLHFIEITRRDQWLTDQCSSESFSFMSDTNITEKNAFQSSNLLESRCGRGWKRFEVSEWILTSFAKLWCHHMLLWLSLPVLTLLCTIPNATLSLPTTNRNQVLWSLLLLCSTVSPFRDLTLIFLLLYIISQFLWLEAVCSNGINFTWFK